MKNGTARVGCTAAVCDVTHVLHCCHDAVYCSCWPGGQHCLSTSPCGSPAWRRQHNAGTPRMACKSPVLTRPHKTPVQAACAVHAVHTGSSLSSSLRQRCPGPVGGAPAVLGVTNVTLALAAAVGGTAGAVAPMAHGCVWAPSACLPLPTADEVGALEPPGCCASAPRGCEKAGIKDV